MSVDDNTPSAGDNSPVQDFYRDCGVLVTGGTGFLGKLVIEKILRCCPAARTVYVLIRPKKGVSAEDRRKALMDNEVFERMKSEQPDWQSRLVFVSGDCSQPRLGLSDTDYHHLTQHVNIVLHLAATVRFDETLKVAIAINVKGTEEFIRLCRDCVHLKSAVYVSTAYSNCIHRVVREEIYSPPMALDHLFMLMDRFTEREIALLLPKITGGWPNTYTFSKAMSENLISTQARDLPVAIVRPSMVISAVAEPIPGWLENVYGPIGIALGGGTGVLHVCFADEEKVLDTVPADMVSNCIIAAAFATGEREEGGIDVYNISMAKNGTDTLRQEIENLKPAIAKFPFNTSIWYPVYFFTSNYCIYMVLAFLLHFLPGLLLDFGLRWKGKPPMMLRIYRKLQKVAMITNYFSLKEWKFVDDNTRHLYEKLENRDKKIFYFDTQQRIDLQYSFDSVLGARKYLLNESLDTLKNARSRFHRFYLANTALKIIWYSMVLWITFGLLKFMVKFLNNF
ncbi:fatty acyl-CoA reductase wat-like [Bacillus rossius redtenbacheri]|uniref:fatty acyl-CoA reductase wat-like n=1 Tax=Bacillus rossius redtenbacheri TaxID=93214 RepID=UPI002FDC9DB4